MENKRFISNIMIGVRIYFVVIVLFIIATIFTGNYFVAAGELIILSALGFYYNTNKKAKQKQITNYIENLTFHLDNATKDSMIHFPLPMTVLNLTGNIIWYNKKFSDIINENVFEKAIQDIIPEIEILKILENKNDISLFVTHNDRYYQIVGNVIEFMQKQTKIFSIVLYWIDKTSERDSLIAAENSKALSCILMVDNYDDLIKNTPDSEAAKLSSIIKQEINKWVSKMDAVVREYEKDKYYIVFENTNLKKMIDDKFDILDSAHEISVGNKIPVTLSIGIGKGENIKQSDEFARASIDMALGRGGDQVVVKDSAQFRFFGGHSEGIEKNTRVKARVVAYALRELIDQVSDVFITGHNSPDVDCIGAAVGLYTMAKNRGSNAYIVLGSHFGVTTKIIDYCMQDEKYSNAFITEAQAMQIISANSLVIVVDTHNPSYVDCSKLLTATKNIVLIDHHRRGTSFIENLSLTYHEPYASSASEMVTEIIQYMEENPKLSVAEAQAIYAGIVLDTKNFSVKTGIRTFEAASFLRRMGVDTVAVKRLFQNDLSMYVKKAKIVSNAQLYKKNIAISVWEEKEEQPNVIASQAADELLNISDVNASFVLCVKDDTIIISGRSVGTYNVQIVLEQLGGGGHLTVAGAQLKGVGINNAMNMLKEAIDKSEQ